MYLRLVNVTKVFPGRGGEGEVTAVDNVSIDIEEGELVTLLGPSGCGKTTNLRMIAGFEFPTSGEIYLDGRTVNDLPPHKRDMSMVFQSYAIFPHLSVYENVAYGLKVQRLPKNEVAERVATTLDLVELGGYEKRAPNQLSGGQQQRVALARALIMEPKVLLMDEPLSNLDAKLREQMRGEIRRIQKLLGITSVYVTHDQEEALSISDRVVVMRLAEIEQIGTPEEIYVQPDTHFVATFVGTINQFPGILVDAPTGLVTNISPNWTISAQPITDGKLKNGDAVTVLIRPDEIHLSNTETVVNEENSLTAVVKSITLLGAVTRLNLDLDGHPIIVDIKTVDRGRFFLDEHVQLSFTREACSVMSDIDTVSNNV